MSDEIKRLEYAIADIDVWRSTIESTPEIAILGATSHILAAVKHPGTEEGIRAKTSDLVYMIQRILRVSQEQVQEAHKTSGELARQLLDKIDKGSAAPKENEVTLSELESCREARLEAIAKLKDIQAEVESERETLEAQLEPINVMLKGGAKVDKKEQTRLEAQLARKTKESNALLDQRIELDKEVRELNQWILAKQRLSGEVPQKLLDMSRFTEDTRIKKSPGA